MHKRKMKKMKKMKKTLYLGAVQVGKISLILNAKKGMTPNQVRIYDMQREHRTGSTIGKPKSLIYLSMD